MVEEGGVKILLELSLVGGGINSPNLAWYKPVLASERDAFSSRPQII